MQIKHLDVKSVVPPHLLLPHPLISVFYLEAEFNKLISFLHCLRSF